jgi:hypothetical protein
MVRSPNAQQVTVGIRSEMMADGRADSFLKLWRIGAGNARGNYLLCPRRRQIAQKTPVLPRRSEPMDATGQSSSWEQSAQTAQTARSPDFAKFAMRSFREQDRITHRFR